MHTITVVFPDDETYVVTPKEFTYREYQEVLTQLQDSEQQRRFDFDDLVASVEGYDDPGDVPAYTVGPITKAVMDFFSGRLLEPSSTVTKLQRKTRRRKTSTPPK